MVWGCGRAFLAMPSLPQIRTASPGDTEDGVRSGSLGRASMFTLALIAASLSLTLDAEIKEETKLTQAFLVHVQSRVLVSFCCYY